MPDGTWSKFYSITTANATSRAGTAYPSGAPEFNPGGRVTRSIVLCVRFVPPCLSFCTFFFWPLHCLFFFDIRILITSLWYLQTLFFSIREL